jgi:hypothetical protein
MHHSHIAARRARSAMRDSSAAMLRPVARMGMSLRGCVEGGSSRRASASLASLALSEQARLVNMRFAPSVPCPVVTWLANQVRPPCDILAHDARGVARSHTMADDSRDNRLRPDDRIIADWSIS